MTGGSLGLRSGSYGSLQYLQNGSVFPVQSTPTPPRKPYKTFKEKESLLHCIFKFAGRKKIGMLFLSVVSAAVFVWVLYVGKGEDSSDNDQMQNITVGGASAGGGYLGSSPLHIQTAIFGSNLSSVFNNVRTANTVQPSSPEYFLGYKLPQNHPCEHFVLPPPPADKKRTGPRPCPVCYLPVEEAIALMPKAPSFSPVIKNLSYVINDNLTKREFGGSEFGGYPSLKQRNDSFDIRESMTVHCGFVRGSHPGRGTGFDMDESDLRDMEQCRGIVVASAIFETFDEIQQPKNISEHAKENACFFMFVDEETEMYMRNQSGLDRSKRLGLWRIVVVRNLAYTDGRRNGKVPKLLMHRMFPNARYSLWIDGKLELVVDPYQILERFLWRKNATFAISKHYKRFDVFVEAEANKAAGKYDNASIDFQVEFYKKEGLTPYTEDKFPIISDVPEGCVLIREHIPISNLFSCLWFNEVDRFTSRDQISFSTVRDKIMAKVDWNIYMFQDCERRNFVVQAYHRDVLEHMAPLALGVHPPPPVEPLPERVVSNPVRRNSVKRGRERRSGSRRHRKVSAGGKGRYLI